MVCVPSLQLCRAPGFAKMVDICLPICAALLVLFTGTLILWTATERLFGQTSNRSAENQAGARLNLFDRERRRWIIFFAPFVCLAALYEITNINSVTYDSRVRYIICNAPSAFIALQSFMILEYLVAILVLPVFWVYILGRFVATTYHALRLSPNFERTDESEDI